MAQTTLQQIRDEIERSYKPREGGPYIDRPDGVELPAIESAGIRSALAALYSSYSLVGQTPPEPPTFRGRMGARLVKLVQRLLFWYTPQIVHFQYSALRATEELAKAVQQLEESTRRDRHEYRAGIAAAVARTEVLERRLEALRLQKFPQIDQELARLKAQQLVQERRIAELDEGTRTSGAAPAQQAQPEDQHDLDALYAALEDEFRGSRSEIKERLSFYLPKLTEAGIGSEAMPVLDVGCGRGEWLELLREQQMTASGIDLNRVLLAICEERGLPAIEAEAVAYLRSLPEASLGAVTAFHLIEHLTLPQLLNLLDAIWRVLKPGGMAIFETPNPNNMFVSSRYFYLDPTHRHPVPPLLGRFLAEARGFERVEILELHPWPDEHRVDTRTGGDVAARFNECFYGPQDYAIIGWKA
jgi:2-polyprenyl-3-methyl-5-hydroxy-6-metoxy-1,4-benzoquinol methylase